MFSSAVTVISDFPRYYFFTGLFKQDGTWLGKKRDGCHATCKSKTVRLFFGQMLKKS